MDSKYRPDVDGLRALAILPVIFFHAGLGCPGGFVGVDVFFVISGFLITSLILKEENSGSFSLAMFWERRLRRIFPALLVVVLASFAAAWIYFTPEDFNWFGQSMAAQGALLSNVYFWLKTNYFDPASDTTPLLHTWSLAVEEQYYVLFPLLLLFLARRKWVSPARAILWLGIGSFILSVVGSYEFSDANFYLLPSRAWELLIGAWLAALPQAPMLPAWQNETLAVAGTSLLAYSIFCFNSATRFPGLAALPPCLGAAFIILSGMAKPTLVTRVLSWHPLVFIGLISYSLYLWHWPLLVFAKYGRPEPPGSQMRLALLLASFAVAVISWRWVETPFRRRKLCARRWQIYTLAGCGLATLLALGTGVYALHGLPSRLPAQAQAIIKDFRKQLYKNNITVEQAAKGQFPALGLPTTNRPPALLLWGDSHAMTVSPALEILCRKFSVRGAEATHFALPPLLGYHSPDRSQDAEIAAFTQAVIKYIGQNHLKTVVIAADWSMYGGPAMLEPCLVRTVQTIQAAGASVFILKDVPGAPFYVPAVAVDTILRDGNLDRLMTHGRKFDDRNQAYELIFHRLAGMGVTILDTPGCFLNSHGFYDVVRDGRILYVDDQHLTLDGAKLLLPMLEPLVRQISEAGADSTPAGNSGVALTNGRTR